MTDRVRVVAHRGSSGTAPENTMAAFHLAAEAGADLIELDVRMTSDGELVVHHDRTLRRTTDGWGALRKKTLGELKTLDAGSWYGSRFRGEKIPTLAEVLAWLPPSLGLNIEVKTDGDLRRRSLAMARLVRTLRERKGWHFILVSSFDHSFLRRLHSVDPSIRTGILYMSVRDTARKPSLLARRCAASEFVCSWTQLRRRFVEDAHMHGITVTCYGVNTRRQLDRVSRFGVDGVITDFPARIIGMLRSGSRS